LGTVGEKLFVAVPLAADAVDAALAEAVSAGFDEQALRNKAASAPTTTPKKRKL